MRPLLLLLTLGLGSAWLHANPVDFVRDVRPILEVHCYDCHGEDKQKSGLRLDAKSAAFKGGEFHGPTIVPHDADSSALIQAVRGKLEDMRMPPKGDPLTKQEIATLTAWVQQGAIWPDGVDLVTLDDPLDHWSFQPLSKAAPPALANDTWSRHEIDRFIFRTLQERALSPAPEADRVTWLRRVTLDLTGLPPTPEEVADFLKDASGDAYERAVDRLLASPRYGERWAQHWLDVVRYADTHGFEVNTPRPNAWPYRDYVIEAFNRDTPYDQFIREQLAGDTMGQDAATGFLVTAAALLPGQIGKDDASKRLARQDELGEMVINVGEAFLGLSIGCARCHDHKFDPISAKDYYAMQAFFAGVDYGERNVSVPGIAEEGSKIRAELEPIQQQLAALVPTVESGKPRDPIRTTANIERFSPVETTEVRLTILSTNKLEPCVDELEIFTPEGENIALLDKGVKVTTSGSKDGSKRHNLLFVNDGQYGNSSSWMSSETGKGWVAIEFPGKRTIDRVTWGRDRDGKFTDRLATDYKVEIRGEDGKWKVIADASSRAPFDQAQTKAPLLEIEALPAALQQPVRNLLAEESRVRAKLQGYPAGGQPMFAGKFRAPDPTHVLRRGDPEQPQEVVAPAILSQLESVELDPQSSDQERRLALAEWIASPDNPLTARVMVNRIWQWHFGVGLVETANDFGNSGVPPTHPELLDWLAGEFIRSGWSVKHLQKQIVLSSTYRQSSRITESGLAADADARLLWRFPSRRLEAEAIRDSMLQISGRLNLKMGGSGFDMFKSRGGLSGFPPVESFSGEGLRRMIYAHKIRMEREAVFGAFDCPDAGQSAPLRSRSTTPVQALNLFNSVFTLEEAEAFASRIESEVGTGAALQVQRAWELAFNRTPDPAELAEAESLVRTHGLPTLCRVLYNTNEFLVLP